MITANQSFNEFKYGAKLQGVNLTQNNLTVPYVVATAGSNVAVNLFGTATSYVTGTIIGFFAVAGATVANTVSVFSTTAGTIASISAGTIAGVYGTAVLSGSVAAGDTVTVSGTTNNPVACFVLFQSA